MTALQVLEADKPLLDKEATMIVESLDREETKSQLMKLGNITGAQSKSYNLMKSKMSTIIQDNPKRKDLEDNMAEIRDAVDELSPDKLSELGFWRKMFTKNPIGRKLQQISEGYESAEKKLNMIETGLVKGSQYLQEDNEELTELFGEIRKDQDELIKNVYILEKVVEEIKEKYKDPSIEKTPQDITFESSMVNKLQDFKMMVETNEQFKVSINLTVGGNAALLNNVERLASVVGKVARTGLMVQTALLKQKKMSDLIENTKDFTGNLLQSNAQMVKDNVAVVKKTMSSPVLDMEKVVASHNTLKEAVSEVLEMKQTVMAESLQSLEKLNGMMDELPSPNKEMEILERVTD